MTGYPLWGRTEQSVLDSLPPVHRTAASGAEGTAAVLDDDPTGTQTVHNIPVVLDWSDSVLLESILETRPPAVFLLTNIRSVGEPRARLITRRAVSCISAAAQRAGVELSFISRSDSTLRGHFPADMESIEHVIGRRFPWVIAPFLEGAGRYTIDRVHYVAEGGRLVPVSETPYAADPAFGFTTSDLVRWVVEKSGSAVPPERVVPVRIDDIRGGGPEAVAAKLRRAAPGWAAVVDAAAAEDIRTAAEGVRRLAAEGRRFLFRAAASWVSAWAGIDRRPLLDPGELGLGAGRPGLVVVGSYVPKTSRQAAALLDQIEIDLVEMPAGELVDAGMRGQRIEQAAARIRASLEAGRNAVMMTGRELVRGGSPERDIRVQAEVSAAVAAVVRRAARSGPAWMVAKGGITACDTALRGLGVRCAEVLGQIAPNVPVWRLGSESRRPGMPYVVFPGNIGGDGDLAAVVRKLCERQRPSVTR